VLEDPAELVAWARDAVRVAADAPRKPRRTKRAARRS
jgi:hypothetical protein